MNPPPSSSDDLLLENAVERAASVGSWLWELETGDIAWSAEMYRILGYAPGVDRPAAEAFFDRIHPEDRPRVERTVRRSLERGLGEQVDYRVVRPDGSVRHVTMGASLLTDAAGRVRRVAGVVADRTEVLELAAARRRYAEALEEAERLAQIGSWRWHIPSNRLEWSQGMFRIFGLDPAGFSGDLAEVVGKAVHPDDRAAVERANEGVARDGSMTAMEYRILRPDGSVRVVWAEAGEPERDGAGRPVYLKGFVQDITERRRAEADRAELEERLHRAQKLEAVGTLAGGVAHDFNNILAALLAWLSSLGLEERAPAPAEMLEMEALIKRGAELTRQLLAIGRRGNLVVEPVDLVSVARKTGNVFSRTRADVDVAWAAPAGLAPAMVDHAQFEQVLLNLLINAGEAMPGGGRIEITFANAAVDPAAAAALGVRPGAYVRLSVRDHGRGIESAVLARIFEPFFTTKPMGQGSGLGLASVYGIVKSHGGAVAVESAPGEGAVFTVWLPASDRPAAPPPPPAREPRRGRGAVLLVDDEALIRKTVSILLGRLGYDVETAACGREAVELVRAAPERFDVVVLDMTMPEMSGAKTFDALRSIAPGLKVLLASGFSEEGQARDLLARGCDGFLQKPFDVAALSEKIAALF